MLKKSFFLFFFLSPLFIAAQEQKRDTIAGQDSSEIYNHIKKIASKNKITYWLYQAIFNDQNKNREKLYDKKDKKNKEIYIKYKGKIIREIEIITLDPFGPSVNDTSIHVADFFRKTGNKLHIKSLPLTVKNQLLFKKGDELDPLSVRESERILRKSSYVRDAKIHLKPILKNPDSIDVVVILQDLWSISGGMAVNSSQSNVQLIEKNFAGLAHRAENTITYYFNTKPKFELNGNYTIPYLKNTFISATVYYSTAVENNMIGISIDRPFFSPLTKWAGGVDILRTNISYIDSSKLILPVSYNNQELWLGRSFQFLPGKTDLERSARFIAAAKIARIHYIKRPSWNIDTLMKYQHSTLYLANLGYSIRRYYKSRNIYRFGETEDVPEGRFLSFIGGIEKKEFGTRFYSGIKIGIGNHLENFGYLSGGIEYGSFFYNKKTEDGVINADLFYFSDRWNFKSWSLREFIYYRHTIGIERKPYEYIVMGEKNYLYGLQSDFLKGNNRYLLNFESIIYTPLNFIGFRFAAIFFAGYGLITNPDHNLGKNKIYQAYGLGLLVRNENLVVTTFELSFGFYPNIPGDRHNVLKFNPLNSYDYKIKDFSVSEPDIIQYK